MTLTQITTNLNMPYIELILKEIGKKDYWKFNVQTIINIEFGGNTSGF